MLDFSSLVLMERDAETGHLIKELGSYEVGEGAEYITKLYYDGNAVNVYFDTHKDVEEWEFTAAYDLFDEEAFTENGYEIEALDDEYNPTWLVRFQFSEEYEDMKERLNTLCGLIEEKMEKVFKDIEGKEEDYK